MESKTKKMMGIKINRSYSCQKTRSTHTEKTKILKRPNKTYPVNLTKISKTNLFLLLLNANQAYQKCNNIRTPGQIFQDFDFAFNFLLLDWL